MFSLVAAMLPGGSEGVPLGATARPETVAFGRASRAERLTRSAGDVAARNRAHLSFILARFRRVAGANHGAANPVRGQHPLNRCLEITSS